MESSEFTMSHEDFPALPGSNPVAAAAAAAAAAANQLNSNQVRKWIMLIYAYQRVGWNVEFFI